MPIFKFFLSCLYKPLYQQISPAAPSITAYKSAYCNLKEQTFFMNIYYRCMDFAFKKACMKIMIKNIQNRKIKINAKKLRKLRN